MTIVSYALPQCELVWCPGRRLFKVATSEWRPHLLIIQNSEYYSASNCWKWIWLTVTAVSCGQLPHFFTGHGTGQLHKEPKVVNLCPETSLEPVLLREASMCDAVGIELHLRCIHVLCQEKMAIPPMRMQRLTAAAILTALERFMPSPRHMYVVCCVCR